MHILIFVFFVFIVVGVFYTLTFGESWASSFLRAFVFTFCCAFFCTVLLCGTFDKIYALRRFFFYLLFSSEVTLGVLLGVGTGHAILEGKISIRLNIFFFSLLIGFLNSIIMTGFLHFRDRLEEKIARLKRAEVENERLKRLETEARLNNLKAKLNPHFLFNILNSLAAVVYNDPAKAEESIVRLSNLYRKILSFSEHSLISLKDEMGLAEDYLELEKLRFGEKLSFFFECPQNLNMVMIPALIVQPLIENAVKHGRHGTENPLQVKLSVREKGMDLFIWVRDNGPGMDVNKISCGFGLYSIQERLKYLYQKNAGLILRSVPGKGTEIELKLPLRRA
ncbi:MAG: histidine kinase [Candidatus Aminicenantes bacterium]|nr:histidine kinase [Candidatus Aminicenantes bacterium]